MNYDDPQFIAAVKKIVNRMLNGLRKNQPDNAQHDPAQEDHGDNPRIISAELRTPVPIRVQNETQDRHPNWNRVKTIAEILGIIAAIGYGYVAIRQWREMISARHQTQHAVETASRSADAADRANMIAQQALESVQRAFVNFPPTPEMAGFNVPNDSILQISIPLENAGNTQAHAVRDRVSLIATTKSLPENYSFPDITGKYGQPWAATGAGVIPPKGSVMSQSIYINESVMLRVMKNHNMSDVRPIRLPTGVIFYGWVTYRDIFKETPDHLTEFCRTLAVFAIRGQQRTTRWSYCPFHNCTDEDCPDYKERIKAANESPTCCPKAFSPKRPN